MRDWSAEPAIAWSETPWTDAERAEVADFMIAQWQAFKENRQPDAPSTDSSADAQHAAR